MNNKELKNLQLELFLSQHTEPVVLLVLMNGNVVEAGDSEVCAEFVGSVGVHAVDYFLPLLIGIGEAIILIYDDEAASFFQCAMYSCKALLYLRPEINRLEGGDKVEGFVGKG